MDKAALKAYRKELGERFMTLKFDNKVQNLFLVIDKETGVEYLSAESGFGAGLTPLLNPDGSPKINDKWKNKEL